MGWRHGGRGGVEARKKTRRGQAANAVENHKAAKEDWRGRPTEQTSASSEAGRSSFKAPIATAFTACRGVGPSSFHKEALQVNEDWRCASRAEPPDDRVLERAQHDQWWPHEKRAVVCDHQERPPNSREVGDEAILQNKKRARSKKDAAEARARNRFHDSARCGACDCPRCRLFVLHVPFPDMLVVKLVRTKSDFRGAFLSSLLGLYFRRARLILR